MSDFVLQLFSCQAISVELLALYQHTKQPLEELEKQITTLREQVVSIVLLI